MLKIKRLSGDVKLPTKANHGDAGWDLYSLEDVKLGPNQRHTFKLGLAIIGEPGKVYKIEGKSGLAVKYGIDTIGNIIDNQYRGEITATLVNTSINQVLEITSGQKIAQLLVQNVEDDNTLIEHFGELEETERGDNGFGSSGR